MNARSIVLVNPISGRGHLDAYARLYSQALCDLGYHVALLADGKGGAIERNDGTFRYYPLSELERGSAWTMPALDRSRLVRSLYERLKMLWRSGGLGAILLYVGRVVRSRVLALAPGLAPRLRALIHAISGRGGQISFGRYVESVSELSRISGAEPALVVFLYLDMMERSKGSVRQLEALPGGGWIGILFHPGGIAARGQAIERYFHAANARGGIFLVPGAAEVYGRKLPALKFVQVPDVADLTTSADRQEWISSLRARAGDRVVVLMAGNIAPQKGTLCFFDVIRIADPKRFFFAVVGEVHWEAFGEDMAAVRKFLETPRENLATHLEYIESEACYNAVISECDIIYAVYKGFSSSSNSLTKAAALRRRILVADGTLMAERVLAFRLGAAAPEEAPGDIYRELQSLAVRPEVDFEFERYGKEHSVDALKGILAEALPEWLKASVGVGANNR